MASINYQQYQKEEVKQKTDKKYVNYFDLKGDGEEALVRFVYTNPAEFNIFTMHKMQINGKWRNIDCLNTSLDDDNCPLCRENKSQRKFFVKLIQYSKDENGGITTQAKIWERSDRYADILNNLFLEYGDISNCVFKIKRSGAKGDIHTKYDIIYANPAIYKPELYAKDFSAFDSFKFSDFYVLSKDANEMEFILNPNLTTESNPSVAPPIDNKPILQSNPQSEPQSAPQVVENNNQSEKIQSYNSQGQNTQYSQPQFQPKRTYNY